ncbi:DEAD-box ATP-dependent RNA helicase CshB [Mesoplasma sp. JKS002658]|uniref:DEAD/DEAH box helicase n=1 Tax=Mesoplasma whartonense TaxID=2878854 RepID=UPI0020229FCC|nr:MULTISPECIES: DEAD/DEAH box helicase [unclassified Mesoplasma]MCL8211148.1 DEAD-box ATP-dependent RNA helicase CshB [Mesoplasma sp. JKS002664]MCL8211809.1 DEAD-box ATP-dependent RNA helicase CshB [Mesoplasma sp. JKS002662]MCL8214086.1 DEAD-box ATP-dependent RNA helicase CshB [Mesoplasma sp. JKS002658]MCL8214486.1 DEAD-box ATP-dependent RNA helicase CshB [Mesoplasma sp. JKS002663]MCL8215405.1 DEAD-box ATP-dependent RNA helicase CshB [Mesoplasma sp. JKS002659]
MNFSDFGFKKFINDGLEVKGFTTPTQVQEMVVPILKKHQNVVGIAHTGTGKTYAFLLPILNNLNYEKQGVVQGLIIAPTRELAKQIYDEVNFFKNFQPLLKTGLYIGGEDNLKIAESLTHHQPLLAIGTPQKLKELYEQNLLKLTTSTWVVVDEFDMIFDLGFFDDLDFLMSKIKQDSVKALFSATINPQLSPFVKKYIPAVQIVDLIQEKKITKQVKNILIDTKNKDNQEVLTLLLKRLNPYLMIIFVNNKNEVDRVVGWLKEISIDQVGVLHGDLPPRMRAAMLKRIKNNEFKYVVATDIAARGIDIPGVSHVVSLGLPKDLSYYVHRAGRSGRNGLTGESYLLLNLKEQDKINYLTNHGINFEVKKFLHQDLVNEKTSKKMNPKKHNLSSEEQIILHKYHDKKVKPGYKKKRKQALETIKKQRRRQHIKENIDKIKKAKYQKRKKEVFGND